MKFVEQLFGGFVPYHETHNAEFAAALQRGEVPDFGDTFFAAPQYPIDTINYLLTQTSYGLFSLDVYVPLTRFASGVQRMVYIEQKLVELAEQYDPAPRDDSDRARQRWRANRYLDYLEMRKRTSASLQQQAQQIKSLLGA